MKSVELEKLIGDYEKKLLASLTSIEEPEEDHLDASRDGCSKDHGVEAFLVADLQQELAKRSGTIPFFSEQMELVAKVMVYLEQGLPYEAHAALLDGVLALSQITRDTVIRWMDDTSSNDV